MENKEDKKFFVINNLTVGTVGLLINLDDFQIKYNGCKVGDYLVVERTSNLYQILDIRKTNSGVIINFEYVMSLKKPFVVDGVLNTYYVEQQIQDTEIKNGCFAFFVGFTIISLLSFFMWLLLK